MHRRRIFGGRWTHGVARRQPRLLHRHLHRRHAALHERPPLGTLGHSSRPLQMADHRRCHDPREPLVGQTGCQGDSHQPFPARTALADLLHCWGPAHEHKGVRLLVCSGRRAVDSDPRGGHGFGGAVLRSAPRPGRWNGCGALCCLCPSLGVRAAQHPAALHLARATHLAGSLATMDPPRVLASLCLLRTGHRRRVAHDDSPPWTGDDSGQSRHAHGWLDWGKQVGHLGGLGVRN